MRKDSLLKIGSYAVVFCGFILMFFLSVPSFDVFFFSRDYDPGFTSFWENSLYYGNGRLLGNLLGISVSHHFAFAFLIVAVSLTLIVFLINKLVFDNSYRTVFLITLAIAFPCKGIFGEVYSVYASFTNYVLPTIFLLAVWCLLKSEKCVLNFIPVFIFSAAACLFSENSTIVVLVSSILFLIRSVSANKKISLSGISFFLGSLCGSLTMHLIPKLTDTSEKLSFYREIKTEIVSLIKSVISVSLSFSNMFSTFIVPIVICSLSLIILVFKQSKVRKSLKILISSYLIFFSAECFITVMFPDDTFLSIYFASLQLVLVVIYAVVVFAALLCFKKSVLKTTLLELYILVLSSIGPLLVVSKYGYRTFYLTFILLFVFACILLKNVSGCLSKYFSKETVSTCQKFIPVIFASVFIFLSGNIFMQSSYNFNFYIVRTQYIAEQINLEADTILVPTLPCKAIVCEDEHPSSLVDITHKSGSESKISEVALAYCQNKDLYDTVLSKNPVSGILYSFSNLEYKSPFAIFSLIKK